MNAITHHKCMYHKNALYIKILDRLDVDLCVTFRSVCTSVDV